MVSPGPSPTDAAPAMESLARRWRPSFGAFAGGRRYLNSCSLGALPEQGREAVAGFLGEWSTRGAAAWYDTWLARCDALREAYAGLLGARAAEVALHPNVSNALASLASALDGSARHRVVVTALDFPTVACQWLARREAGVELVVVPSDDGISVPTERLVDAIDDRTLCVATSDVFYTSGARQDLRAIAEAAHRSGALVIADGYQAAGQVPVDVHALGVDAYLGGGLKWLLGGPGIAFAWVHPRLSATASPRATGWFALENQFAFDATGLDRHDDARRFEAGTPAMAAVSAQLAGLAVLASAGMAEVQRATAALARDCIATAEALGLSPRVPPAIAERTAIVAIPSDDPAGEVARLAAEGITVDARPGIVRVSPYFYNLPDDHRTALARLAALRPTVTSTGARS